MSAAHHAGYGGGCLFYFLINYCRITCTFGFNCGVGDAMPHMFFEQVERDRVKRFGNRRDLSKHVNTVLVFLDHAGDTAHLPFDAAQALQMRLLVWCIPVWLC